VIFPQTRPEARAAGLTFYCGGRPCKAGHSLRYVSTANCAPCLEMQQAENADSIRVRASAWHQAHTEISVARARERRIKFGSGFDAASHSRRRAAKEGHQWGKDFVLTLLAAQKSRCMNCLKKFPAKGHGRFHVDHIMPLALGGSNAPSNIQLLCAPCNLRKSAKHPLAFARQCGRLL
jgi:5-methylcytosine-specific restriction endonuclease McrA